MLTASVSLLLMASLQTAFKNSARLNKVILNIKPLQKQQSFILNKMKLAGIRNPTTAVVLMDCFFFIILFLHRNWHTWISSVIKGSWEIIASDHCGRLCKNNSRCKTDMQSSIWIWVSCLSTLMNEKPCNESGFFSNGVSYFDCNLESI